MEHNDKIIVIECPNCFSEDLRTLYERKIKNAVKKHFICNDCDYHFNKEYDQKLFELQNMESKSK